MDLKLFVDSEEFWINLKKDLAKATEKVCIQMMTFEGDSAGLKLADAVVSSGASEKRVLVDEFTRYMISDRFIYTPGNMRDKELQAEVKSTLNMFKRFEAENVGVKWTNPVGFMLRKFPGRNHKKIFLVDNVVYLGGINFSDHNLSWHDMMIRIESDDFAALIYEDFMATWGGKSKAHHRDFDKLSVQFLNGYENEKGFQKVIDLIDRAEKEILVISPYISFPIVDHLRAAGARGVKVRLITPGNNNRESLRKYLTYESRGGNMELYLYNGMLHLKGMLIDDECLIMGSSNFDYISYRIEEELLVYVRDSEIIKDFRNRVFMKDLDNSERYLQDTSGLKGRLHKSLLKLTADIAVGICGRPGN